MGSFANNVITDAGRILHADCLAGAVFTPTRIVIGSGTLPSGTAIASLTAVITPVKSLTINKAQRTPDGKAIFGGVYSNKDITQDFYFRELALYAKGVYLNDDGTVRSETAETLYSYGNAGSTADLMRAYSTEHVVERQMDLVCWVGNTAKVNLTIASDVYVTREQIADMGVHMKNTHNPHGVTAAQVGADVSGAAAAVQANLDTHTADKSNPHNVTCDQIGAIKSSMLGKPNGPAKLGADGILSEDQLPPVSGSLITITFESAFQGATWTLTGGGENYSGVVDSSLKAVVSVKGVNTLYAVSAAVSGTTYTAEITTLDYFTALALALTRFQSTITVTVDSGSTVTAVCGTTTLTKTSTGTAIFTVGKAGTWTITATKDGETATGTVEITASGQSNSLTLDYAAVFGVCWDTSNSSTALTRLAKTSDPYGFVTKNVTTEPVSAVGTGAGSSPFDSFMPWSGMKVCNLDKNGAVTAWKGDNGFSYEGIYTMVYIPTFYIAVKQNGTKKYLYISDREQSGFAKHPGSGKFVGRYLYGTYNTISESGDTPLVNVTRAQSRAQAKSQGVKYRINDFATYCAIVWLYLIEFANWNCQKRIGRGYVDNNSAAIKHGGTDSMIYHTGRAAGTDGKTAVQYRWIENLWGNVSQWIDGFNANGTSAYYCLDPSKYADDTTSGYTFLGTLPASGYITDVNFYENGLLHPSGNGGSETTFITDYADLSSGWLVLYVGGSWDDGSYAGLLCFVASNTSSDSDSIISARLLCEA